MQSEAPVISVRYSVNVSSIIGYPSHLYDPVIECPERRVPKSRRSIIHRRGVFGDLLDFVKQL